MDDSLVFYTNPMSRGRVARWMLEEAGVPYETRLLDYGTTMKAADYLAINPMGKVPAIVHNGHVVTENAAICAYLADAFPDAGLAPPTAERHAYYRWLFFAAGPMESALTNRALGLTVPPDREATAGYGNVDLVISALTAAVSASDYIAGDRFSAADVHLGSHIGWGMQFGTLEKKPEFETYWARISNRDAFRRAKEIDDALLPQEGD